jgi:hypothetical protein
MGVDFGIQVVSVGVYIFGDGFARGGDTDE